MKKLFLIVGFVMAMFSVNSYAENLFSGYASTTSATICNSPTSVDWFHVVNSSNVAQNITIYDGSTAKLTLLVPASSDRSYTIPSKIKFNTSVAVVGEDLYSNQKVKFYMNQW
jgi:hypothetical protein